MGEEGLEVVLSEERDAVNGEGRRLSVELDGVAIAIVKNVVRVGAVICYVFD